MDGHGIGISRFVVVDGGETARWRDIVIDEPFSPTLNPDLIKHIGRQLVTVIDSFATNDEGESSLLLLLQALPGGGLKDVLRHVLQRLSAIHEYQDHEIQVFILDAVQVVLGNGRAALESAEEDDCEEDMYSDEESDELSADDIPPVYEAISRGDADAVREAVSAAPELLRPHGQIEVSPLLFAINSAEEDCARVLLDNGADPNSREGCNVDSVSLAVFHGMEDLALALLDARADPHVRNPVQKLVDGEVRDVPGAGILWTASRADAVRLVDRLLALGVDVNSQDSRGNSALKAAAAEGNLEVVETLLRHGAAVDLRDEDGWTALMNAANADNKEIVQMLLAAGADPNICNSYPDEDNRGRTTLMDAANSGNLEVVNMLLDAGANVNVMTEAGATAFRSACLHSRTEVAARLLEAGADPDASVDTDAEIPILPLLLMSLLSEYDKERIDFVRSLIERGVRPGGGRDHLDLVVRGLFRDGAEEGNPAAVALASVLGS